MDDAKARRARAQSAIERRDFQAARTELEPLVMAEPGNPDGHGLLAAVRAETGDLAGAVGSYATALRLRPGHGPTARLLGATLLKLNAVEQALAVLTPAAATAPDDAGVQAAYAEALVRAERFAEAADAVRRAILRDPESAAAWVNLATAKRLQGDLEGALEAAEEAIGRQRDLPEAHVARALALLSLGRYEEGWTENEWYWRQDHTPPRPLPQPWWNGEAIDGAVAVWGDGGIGDELWAGAFLPPLLRAGHRLVLECAPRLVSLFRRSFPRLEVVPAMDPPEARLTAPDIAAQTPLSRLASLAWRRDGTAERPAERLAVDGAIQERLRRRYEELAQGRRLVGIAWRSRRLDGQPFAVPLVEWEGLLRRPGLFVVDLQQGDTEAEREEARRRLGAAPYHDPEIGPLGDMDLFAAQVAAMDGVAAVAGATVSTAVAVGTPATVAVRRFQPDWRYRPGQEESPWMPGARLIRQQDPGRWDDVVERIATLAAE